MNSRNLAILTVPLSIISLSACSIDNSSSTSSSPAKPSSVTINGVKTTIPVGYTYGDQTTEGTSTTTILIDSKGAPLNFTVATNPQGFDMKNWCTQMETSFKDNLASGGKVTSHITKDSCTIEGHGKTKNASGTSTQNAAPSSSSAPSGYTNKSIPAGSDYSIYTSLKKAKNGAYIAMLSRHLDPKSTFSVEKTMFNTVAK